MHSWSLLSSQARPGQQMLARTVSLIGDPRFAQEALGSLGAIFSVGSWSVYELLPARPPQIHLSASRLAVDSTADCFATYRDTGLYRQDHSFDMARRRGQGSEPVMLKTNAGDMAEPHREAIYRRHAMLERLSVAQAGADGAVLAINLYRHEGEGCFSASDTEGFAAVALPLLATVRRHLACGVVQEGATSARDWLQRLNGGLTERELDVLDLLLQGLTYDGIAAGLGLGIGTVKTYRARAFERLGIHFKNELFALAMRHGMSLPRG